MAKLFGISGKATGRKGDTVFAVRNGEQLIRQYNPMVKNPSTSAQVNARAALKMLSQLSQIMAPVVAIAREGAVSPRNLFTKINYPQVDVRSGVATIDLTVMKITRSNVAMENVNASRNGSTNISVAVANSLVGLCDRVVYVGVTTDASGKIRVLGSTLVNVTNGNSTAQGNLPYSAEQVTILAYGIKDTNAKATAAFANINGDAATHAASLIATRALASSDVTYTETKGTSLAAL